MLHTFLTANRDRIIAKTRDKVVLRSAPRPSDGEITHGVPVFLDQVISRLGASAEGSPFHMSSSASLHGRELLEAGFTIGQVVHDYGDICQAITELADEEHLHIEAEEFRALNLCLDIATAEAVTEYTRQREQRIVGDGRERLGFLTHELRNLLNTATLAFDAVRTGTVGIAGSTGTMLGNSLASMRDLITRSLAEMRLEAGPPVDLSISVAQLLEEIEIAALLQVKARDIQLVFSASETDLNVDGDLQIAASILTNLIQNACKFTRVHGHVTVQVRASNDRVYFDVEDECGGLPPGAPEELFRTFTQRGSDRSGLGLGLPISLKGARAMKGDITVRDLPGHGCVFTLEMRRSIPPADSRPGALRETT